MSAFLHPLLSPSLARARRWRRAVFLLLSALLLAACSRDPAPQSALPQDVYIWQRQWTPALRAALTASDAQVARWHVLAAELGASGRWIDVTPDSKLLSGTGKPLLMTVRINGQLARFDAPAIEARILQLLADWRQRGLSPAALEIDYDCATAKLPEYTAFLNRLKPRLGDTALAITALPTWLGSPRLDALLAAADESTLQVHAVLDPRQGLFDPERAHDWMAQFSQRTRRPWHVALPAYGSRVVWDNNGALVAVESERPVLAGGVASELVATPRVLARFVTDTLQRQPRGLAGIAWFRLPTGDDRRAWSLSTWLAVLERRPLQEGLVVRLATTGEADGAPREIMLDNPGNADAPLPARIRIGGACAADLAGDGINGYAMENDGHGRYLRLTQHGLLRAGARRNIGWLRCADGAGRQNDIALQIGS
ncbi:MAG: hypothetical protein GAK35_00161 [Herbaspirillum frisingense]|uniref:DUF3142 domain-containing protein n=1 Tax=Herbaspirillum frisingense TaxID=92645 RepID=A0A7V8JWA4_9BURK|nr:MAG: hypothetical protein GAK35_00161 [Herbaspirillum frisingense]